MMARNRKQQHVVPHGDGWGVRRSGSSRVTKQHKTQRDAIDHAKSIAKNQTLLAQNPRREARITTDKSLRDQKDQKGSPITARCAATTKFRKFPLARIRETNHPFIRQKTNPCAD